MSTPQIHLETLPRSIQLLMVMGFVALAVFPFVGSEFYTAMVVRMMILAIFAMSLDLLQGVTGLVSLGHAAYFGLAGYVLAFITPQNEPISLHQLAFGGGRSCAGGFGDWLFGGAHAWHLLHHGDHGICANGVLYLF